MNAKEEFSFADSLKVVDGNVVELQKFLQQSPAFLNIAQDILLEEVQRALPEIFISRTYINARNPGLLNPEPTGKLVEVFAQCLSRGKAPAYNPTDYGVYDWPGSADEVDRVPGLEVADLGTLIGEVMSALPSRYARQLDAHWAMSAGRDEKGNKLAQRSVVLRDLYAAQFWSELNADNRSGDPLLERDARPVALLKDNPAPPVYNLSLRLEDGRYALLACCFVAYQSGRYDAEQLLPGNDEQVLLYTPDRGLQTFKTSAVMHEVLEYRLNDEKDRDGLLSGLALADRAALSDVVGIRYLKTSGELFQTLIENVLVKQRRDVEFRLGELHNNPAEFTEIVKSVEALQRSNELIDDAKGRIARLLARQAKYARPHWLTDASPPRQQTYEAMERSSLAAEVALHEAMGGLSSLQEYARQVVQEHVSQGSRERVDPDTVGVVVKHSVQMGTRRIEYVERKTLTQLFMYGNHDSAGRYSIQFEEFQNNPRLTAANIERAIRDLDLRLIYASERTLRLNAPSVREAMREALSQRIALSSFAAGLQKHISPRAQDLVQRCLFGDPGVEVGGVVFNNRMRPFKDMMVFRNRAGSPQSLPHVLYAPGAPSGRQWYEFNDLTGFQRQFIQWGFEPRDREFLIGQAHAIDRKAFIKDYLSVVESARVYESWWWGGVALQQWTGEPLQNAVRNLVNWDILEEQVVTPLWYRKSALADRELLARLNTEFKAIAQVSEQPLNMSSLSAFSRELVMGELNSYLRRFGVHPHIDPDRVKVKLRGHDYMTLTQLFIQWQLWSTKDPVYFISVDNTPLERLSETVVSALIHLRPGEQYDQYLRKNFLQTPDFELKAKLYCKAIQNEMLKSALIQKMQGSLSADQFNWLRKEVEGLDHDSPDQSRAPLGGGLFEGINTFTLQGRRLEGAYTFVRRLGSGVETLIYLPKAPDGKAFRVLGSLAADLQSHELGEHVVSLVRLSDRSIVERLVDKCRNEGGTTQTPIENAFPVYQFNSEYRSLFGRLLYDVDHQTTTAAENFWGKVLIGVELVVDIVSLFVPPVGLAASIVRITRSIVEGTIAYGLGDEDAGKAHFASAWRSSILLYVGIVAGVGTSTSAVGLLSRIKDLSDIVSTVTNVQVGIPFVTALATHHLAPVGEAQIIQ